VARLPYNTAHSMVPPSAIDPDRAVDAGFAVVCQDSRGRLRSEGRFYPFLDDASDGYDTIEWAAAQPWSSGAVGMAGRSYGACAQWLAAAQRPPHLRAIFPVLIGSSFRDGWVYQGGAFQLGFNVFWALLIDNPRQAPKALTHARHLPLLTAPVQTATGERASFYFDWLHHPPDDPFWEVLAVNRHYARVEVPAFHVGGWYDVFLGGTLENFTRMRREAGSERARRGQRLLVGPWGHGSTYGAYPDHSYPQFAPDDAVDLTAVQLRYFARHLRGEGDGEDDAEAPVRIFVMGENRWRDEDDWPLARSREVPYYLHGDAAGGQGRGLSPEKPSLDAPDEYVFDPRDPAPTIGGPTSMPGLVLGTSSGPLDQQRLFARSDVLLYASPPLAAPLEVTGPLRLKLWAATTATDTDFVAKLVDLEPGGPARLLAEGILRARWRGGFDAPPQPVEPGAVVAYEVDLVATSHLFARGHRVGLVLTSSSFPRFDRNPNTGHPLGVDGPDDLVAARQTVFHDPSRPSHLVLPVVPR
jgi:putative CocE/NonD family hydrolase